MIRVAFTLIGGNNWTGGYNYLLNLLRVLGGEFSDRITPVLFAAEESTREYVAPLSEISGVELVRSPLLNLKRRNISLLQALVLGRDVPLKKLFDANRIDIIFEAAQFFGWRFGLPAIAWIPDFQHLALPDMFTAKARWKREIGFRAQILGRRIIMLSSEDARRTCVEHYPMTKGYTKTVHFAVPTGSVTSSTDARRIAGEYELPEIFFYMPNQMWKHKNHILVVRALALLRQRGVPVVIAASGKQEDPRDPEIYTRIKELVKQLGVEGDIRFLGLIPYSHVTALMSASSALINPSLFEGWSTTVEEARAMGVPMLLSDLDVHLEQMGNHAIYFDRHAPQTLADRLQHFQPLDEVQREKLSRQAMGEAEQRVTQFGEDFAQLAESCAMRNED